MQKTITVNEVIEILKKNCAYGSIGLTLSNMYKMSKLQIKFSRHKEHFKYLASHAFILLKPPIISEAAFPILQFSDLGKYLVPGSDTWLYHNDDLIIDNYNIGEAYCRGSQGRLYGIKEYAGFVFKYLKQNENYSDTCSEHVTYVTREEFKLPFIPTQITKEKVSPSRIFTWLETQTASLMGWQKILDFDGSNLTLYGEVYKLICE